MIKNVLRKMNLYVGNFCFEQAKKLAENNTLRGTFIHRVFQKLAGKTAVIAATDPVVLDAAKAYIENHIDKVENVINVNDL